MATLYCSIAILRTVDTRGARDRIEREMQSLLWLCARMGALGLWLAFGIGGCANAPRVTLDQIPVYPGALPLASGEYAASVSFVNFVMEQEAALARNFKWKGAHAEVVFRLPTGNKPEEVRSWYFEKLTTLGWRSVYSAAYTVYTNGAGQYLTVYILASETTEEEHELVLTLNEKERFANRLPSA